VIDAECLMSGLMMLLGALWLQAMVPDPPFSGGVNAYEVRAGESIVSIASRTGLEPRILAADNGMSPMDALKPGQGLLVDNRHVIPEHPADGIVVNVPQRMLFVFVGGHLSGAYPVAVGQPDWPTPLGTYVISGKEVDPTWDVPKSIQEEMEHTGQTVNERVPPGPDNPLGDRWIRISNLSLGIHGTNQPTSIYRFTTHGCVRLHPDDARSLFNLARVGMPVWITYEPVLVAAVDADHVMVEVHADVYRRMDSIELEIARHLGELDAGKVDLQLLTQIARRKAGRGVVIDRVARQPSSTW
jgi:L,D-transpeptidase ErfK/SrfK